MSRRVISGCSVLSIPAHGDCAVLPGQDIEIADGAIEHIVPTAPRSDASEVEVIDGTGLLAVPGLTNAHTHSPMVLMRGAVEDVSVAAWFNDRVWPMECNLTPERVRAGARLACAEMLLSGVTAFADHYFYADEIAAAATELGIRADIAPTFFSVGEHGREAAFETADRINEAGCSRVRASLGPHSTYTVTDADLRATADRARERGLRVHLHAAENMDQTRSSLARLGVTPMQVLERTGLIDAGVLVAHGGGITPADIPLLAASPHTAVACCPKVYLKHAINPITPIRALRDAGIAVGAGTDGAAGHNTLDVWEALRLVAMMSKYVERDATYLTVSQALQLAFRGGAAAAGLRQQTGALEVGRRADIVLVDLSGPHCRPVHDPAAALVYSVRASDVVTVLVDGEVVVRDRQLMTGDLSEIAAEADRVAAAIVDIDPGRRVANYEP